jgi:hypothetical protein
MSAYARWRRAQRDRNRDFGAGVLLLLTLPTGDSWSPHWIVATALTITLVVSPGIAWVCAAEVKRIEEGR